MGLKYKDKIRIEKSVNLVEPRGKILDIGCKDGEISKLTKDKNNYVYGVDRKVKALQIAQKRGIKTKVCDLDKKIPFPKKTFDGAICLEVIEHIYNTDLLLSEINKVLKNNAYFVLSTPNICALRNRLKILFGKQPCYFGFSPYYSRGGLHIRVFNKNSLIKLLEIHGFKIEKIIGNLICFSPFKYEPTRSNSIKFLADIFPSFSDYLIIKARKIKEDTHKIYYPLKTSEMPKNRRV